MAIEPKIKLGSNTEKNIQQIKNSRIENITKNNFIMKLKKFN